MGTVKVGSVVKIKIDKKIETTITIISKTQYKKIRQGNKKTSSKFSC